jgi:hypothetical protein
MNLIHREHNVIVTNSSSFKSEDDAIAYMRANVFPEISSYVRLYKTPQARQDEYMLVRPLNGSDEDQFLPSIYRLDRDINDMLASAGIPDQVIYPAFNSEGNPVRKKIAVLPAWRRDQNVQVERLFGLCYLPNGAAVVNGKLNTYRDVSVPAVLPASEDSVKEILHHIRHNICNARADYGDYLIKWLAHMVQFPQIRPKTAIAVIGEQGTGKGVLMDFLKQMLGGERNCNTTASSTDTKSFNYALANKLLVVFDEATFAGDRTQSDFMKKLISEPKIRVEQKGLDAYEVENFTRVLITSNNMASAVPAGVGARRWLIMECRNDVNTSDLKCLATIIGNNGAVPGAVPMYVNKFKAYLQSISLDDFDPLALPEQDTGFDNKLSVLYKEDPLKAFFWEWLIADDLTFTRAMKSLDRDTREPVEYTVPVCWEPEVLFADFYAVFDEQCQASHVKTPARNRIKALLKPFGATTTNRSEHVIHVVLPHPSKCLEILYKTSRFDRPITPTQKSVIYNAWKDQSVKEKMKRSLLNFDLDDSLTLPSGAAIDGSNLDLSKVEDYVVVDAEDSDAS